jgi:hypothetical protein
MRLLLVGIATLTIGCTHQGRGYRTSSVAEAILATAEIAAAHPEMLVPRSEEKQAEMEADADTRLGPQIVPERLLGRDTFLSANVEHPTIGR